MLSYQRHDTQWQKERENADLIDVDKAGPLTALGIYVLFLVGTSVSLAIVRTSGDEALVRVLFLGIAPAIGAVIASRLRSWWWVLFTTLVPLMAGLFLPDGEMFRGGGRDFLIIAGVNLVFMSVVTMMSRSPKPFTGVERADTSLPQSFEQGSGLAQTTSTPGTEAPN